MKGRESDQYRWTKRERLIWTEDESKRDQYEQREGEREMNKD